MSHPAILAALFVALGLTPQDAATPPATPPATPKPLPSSLVPVPRTEPAAVARQDEVLLRARESAPVDVVFLGDSITQSWEGPGREAWETHIAPFRALNLGASGDRTEHVLWRLQQAPLTRLHPKAIVVLIGTNNLGHGTSNPEETLVGVLAVVSTLLDQCPESRVILLDIFPRGERFNAMRGDICQINQTLSTFGERKTLDDGKRSRLVWYPIGDRFLEPIGSIRKEIMPDALHLTPRGYEIWAEAIVPALKKYAR
jgi:lysophospholipase L1-like esterase